MSLPSPSPRVAAFERLGYGLFITWGLHSQLGRGEWIQYHAGIPVAEYAKLKDTFTAADFDAVAVARLVRESGMRYACLTTRHHEGFSLYDTRGLSDFDAPHSPAGRDLVAEFVEASRAEGIVPILYHTTLDWRWDSAHCSEERFSEYLDHLQASVEVLCTQYGPVGGFWFDGNWSRAADWREERLYAMVRRHQPEAILINNSGLHAQGAVGHPELDCVTFEQGLPAAPDRSGWPKYLAGEMCETLNSHWGIGRLDFNYKGPAELIRHLCACRKTGANYLLNIGPAGQGGIPAYEAAALRKVGEWIAHHGNALFDGHPVAACCEGQDFLLQDGHRFFYFAHNLSTRGDAHVVKGGIGNGPRSVREFPPRIESMRWLDTGETGVFSQKDGTLTLDCAGYEYGNDLVVRVAKLEGGKS